MSVWKKFPYDAAVFDYPGDNLRNAWGRLHAGDREVFPESERLQNAWRCFHRGEFAEAVNLADEQGIEGHAVANKATGIYATYLEDDENQQLECFRLAINRAEKAVKACPDDANSHYFHAFNLGRYSQSISVVKALKQGVGSKISSSLRQALKLQPKHAEAHTAMGMYHSEILDKVGKLIGSVTYGANEKDAIKHFELALKLTPHSPIAHIEYANGLYLIYGDARLDDITELYVTASEMTPADAMEKLDVESALSELE